MVLPNAENARLGTQLTREDQRHVLAAYVHRFTVARRPHWANQLRPQFIDDQDWLAHTWFAVRKDGRLDQRAKACYSQPTWPQGQ